MKLNVFKKRWLKKKYRSAKEREPKLVDYRSPDRLMIITTQNHILNYEECVMWAELLGVSPDKMDVLSYAERPREQPSSKIHYFNNRILRWRGGLRDKPLEKTLSRHHDLQINYFTERHESLKFVASCSSASLKAGLPNKGMVYNDLTIDVPEEDKEEFIDELLRYLEILTEKTDE